jgi:RNA polymerase sigma-70 factor (ECF subfamily)
MVNTGERYGVKMEEEDASEQEAFWRDRDDEKKVLEFLAGRREALADLFRRYRKDVYQIAFRYSNNADDALEITQEVFAKLLESLETFRRGSRFYTWLYRVAVNQSIDFLRRRKRRAAAPLQGEEYRTRDAGADPVKRAERSELAERLHEALGRLSDKHRAVLVLHSLENLSYREIAQVVGCSIGTVMSRLFYARRRLAEILGEP